MPIRRPDEEAFDRPASTTREDARYSRSLDNQPAVSSRPRQIARLAPLLARLALVWRRRSGEIPDALKDAGRQGPRHIGLLMSLAIEGPATVSELAYRMDMTAAHASLVVGELARAGLVEREHDERDRRLIVVSLSESTKPAVAEMRRRSAAPLLAFLGELDEAEGDKFIDQLTRLVAHMKGDAT